MPLPPQDLHSPFFPILKKIQKIPPPSSSICIAFSSRIFKSFPSSSSSPSSASMAAALNLNLNIYLMAINFLFAFPFLIPLSESQIAPSTDDDPGINQSQNRTSICDHTIFSFLPPGYRHQRGFQCSHAWDSIYFKFIQDNNNVTTVILSREKFSGWMGIGFSKDGGMVGSIAVVGWTGKPGKDGYEESGIAKFFLQGKDEEGVIAFEGRMMNFTDTPPFVITYDNLFYMGFQGKFDRRLGQQYVILAMGSDQPSINCNHSDVNLTKHTNQAVMQVDFSSGLLPEVKESPLGKLLG